MQGHKGAIAYFSMDVAIAPQIPTYSGGLGVLAGDTLHSAADLGLAMVGVTLVQRKGYFDQQLDALGNQIETPTGWSPENYLESLPARVTISVEGRPVRVKAWRYLVQGSNGNSVPLFFLDTDLQENHPYDRTLTDHLYGGDERYRLCQEVVLGFGGIAMVHELGYHGLKVCHMNEGHSAFVTLALLEFFSEGDVVDGIRGPLVDTVRKQCVFTTHTPVPAGHDRFGMDLVGSVLGEKWVSALVESGCCADGVLNMTELALHFSRYTNGVSMRHGEVSRSMFRGRNIEAITNGVHPVTWTAPSFQKLYDRHMPKWRCDSAYLRYAVSLPLAEIREAHDEAKRALIDQVRQRTGAQVDESIFTVGFARRAAAYKRADLLFFDLERLRSMALHRGPLQIVYGGKAHPRDECGKAVIRRIYEAAGALGSSVRVAYLENYDMVLGQLICAGVDLWLNTPLRPQEASGTSGMKAALNGVPSLSVLDGWWIEGHVEGVTGWAIEEGPEVGNDDATESRSLYNKLEHVILPLFYGQPEEFAKVMRSVIALNGSFFNTQRMLSQYMINAYDFYD
jgi:starch phosphorylase